MPKTSSPERSPDRNFDPVLSKRETRDLVAQLEPAMADRPGFMAVHNERPLTLSFTVANDRRTVLIEDQGHPEGTMTTVINVVDGETAEVVRALVNQESGTGLALDALRQSDQLIIEEYVAQPERFMEVEHADPGE